MALRIENISKGKIIGIGPESILPGESKTVSDEYAKHPAIKFYVKKGFARIESVPDEPGQSGTDAAVKPDSEEDEAAQKEAAEMLRKARLASLKGISDEALGKLAQDLGINPAECKDNADVLKKVKAALKP